MTAQRSARPCRGPHHCRVDGHKTAAVTGCPTCPPIVSTPLCQSCRDLVKQTIERIPDAYIACYLALEPGRRYQPDTGNVRSRRAEAPLPLDAEASAAMGRILEVVVCWHDVVVAAANLSGTVTSNLGRGRGGVAITTACRTLVAHLDTLLDQPAWSVTRSVPHHRVARTYRAPVPDYGDVTTWVTVTEPLLADDTLGMVRGSGHATTILDLDGVDAALELLALERQTQATLGDVAGDTHLAAPCQNPDCGASELYLGNGSDYVRCRACGEEWPSKDYQRLAAILLAEAQDQATDLKEAQ